MKAVLALADGRIFEGTSFGAQGEVTGEIIFNTSMTGYQEVITDPSYCGQMIVMTYPLIGNYGVNPEDFESDRPHLSSLIIKELSSISSNWRSYDTLHNFLTNHGIPGIHGVDTRALTKHIRNVGAQQAILSTLDTNPESLVRKVKKIPCLKGRDLVKEVTCKEPYEWHEEEWGKKNKVNSVQKNINSKNSIFIIAYDYGIKRNILRMLKQFGCNIKVVPASMPANEVLAMRPNGILLSNGPGDPTAVPYALNNVKHLIGKVPILGICLGHQILTLALGATIYKMKFGHHGGNQPVMNLKTRRVEITSQNHGFAVEPSSINTDYSIRSINLNDNTVEGICHNSLPIISIQYHPEASPGPHDSSYIFKEFIDLIEKIK